MNKELVKLWNRYGDYPSWRVPNSKWAPREKPSIAKLAEEVRLEAERERMEGEV